MSSSSETPPVGGDEDAPFSGFDEIEDAFNKVSIAADTLLDSIRDDSLRGKQRRDSRKINQHKSAHRYEYYTDSDDNNSLEGNNKKRGLSPYEALTGYKSRTPYDDSSLLGEDSVVGDDEDGEESLDGSLVNDMHNLRSITKAIQEDLRKQGQEFEANVKDNGKTFFSKLEEDGKSPNKLRNLNLDTSSSISMNKRTTTTKTTTPVKSIDIRRKTKTPPSALKTPKVSGSTTKSKQQQSSQPVRQKQPPEPSFLEQLRQFCNNLLGKRPNVSLFLINLVLWAVVIRMWFVAKDCLMDHEGQLSPLSL